jgi:hypothetical protein
MPVLPRPTSLMIMYLPIFSGSDAPAPADLAVVLDRDMFKLEGYLECSCELGCGQDTGGTSLKL